MLELDCNGAVAVASFQSILVGQTIPPLLSLPFRSPPTSPSLPRLPFTHRSFPPYLSGEATLAIQLGVWERYKLRMQRVRADPGRKTISAALKFKICAFFASQAERDSREV